jgi:hypothetical protein
MPAVALRLRARILLLCLFTVTLASAAAVFGVNQNAQAFGCMSVNPKPISCPFVKIEQAGAGFNATGQLLDANGNVLHSWEENHLPDFVLWHWRWYGANDHLRVVITPAAQKGVTPPPGGPKTFDFPANESHCYQVNESGVFPVGGCNDSEDPPQ